MSYSNSKDESLLPITKTFGSKLRPRGIRNIASRRVQWSNMPITSAKKWIAGDWGIRQSCGREVSCAGPPDVVRCRGQTLPKWTASAMSGLPLHWRPKSGRPG